ncbi:MAG TPA: MetQ/NlpA family ABC transporter substrate-binding protein [Spirochaetota bacterium]|nr:MetQ/NlpA family ABC transporter substrate-binding protein [Spirochaetota bacterium]HPJ34005.1 MetQ/NlpA family ABC transporter substrate-binding protein [Spirochaetota bacterium]
MKKKLTLITIALLFAFFSCKGEKTSIKLGILPVIDTLPLIVADSDGLFKEEGIDVDLVVFNSALEKEAALTSGNLDGAFGDLIAALLQIKNGNNIKIATESYHTSEKSRMFALLASPSSGISSIKKTGDAEVAISMGSIIEFFLDRMMIASGMKPSAIKRIEVKAIPVRMQMLMSNSLQMALLPEPLASKAVKEGAKLLADDRNLNTTATVIIFKESFLSENSEAMKKFIRAYNRSVDRINKNPDVYKELMMAKIRFPKDLKDTYKIPSYNSVRLPSEKDVMLVYDWMKSKGMIKAPVEYQNITWSLQK